MTRNKYSLSLATLIVAASFSMIREYWVTGTVTQQKITIVFLAFIFGLGVVSFIGWWANRPEGSENDE